MDTIVNDRLGEYLAKLPLPTALAYVLGVPSALIGFGVIRGVNSTRSELLGIWLMLAGLLLATARSESKDWLYWLGVITSVATVLWAFAVS